MKEKCHASALDIILEIKLLLKNGKKDIIFIIIKINQ